METSKSIDIEYRVIKGMGVQCYVPKINNVPVLDKNGFILKESINDTKKITNNYPMVQTILNHKIEEIESFLKKNSKFFEWVEIVKDDDNTFPEEGTTVIVSDGKHYDVAWYIRSGEYKWVKTNVEMDDLDDFTAFIPTKWKMIT